LIQVYEGERKFTKDNNIWYSVLGQNITALKVINSQNSKVAIDLQSKEHMWVIFSSVQFSSSSTYRYVFYDHIQVCFQSVSHIVKSQHVQ
jgi:hypothetical protein